MQIAISARNTARAGAYSPCTQMKTRFAQFATIAATFFFATFFGCGESLAEDKPRELPPAGQPLTPAGYALASWKLTKGWEEAGAVTVDPQDAKQLKSEPGQGIIVAGGKGKANDLLAQEAFGDIEAHVEFMIPSHSNSGVYFMGSYEVQVYDSFGVRKDKYPGIECGGIYPEWINNANSRGHSPLVNASLPPGQWQTFDVVFRAPRFNATGKKIANARFVKVVHNGTLVHENVELFGPTRGGLGEKASGPLRLQGDHGPVAYRNIRIRPLPGK